MARCVGRGIWIIGDLMMDEYVHGEVSRISPEAPVQVVRLMRGVQIWVGPRTLLGRWRCWAHMSSWREWSDRTRLVSELIADCTSLGIDTRAVRCRDVRKTTRKFRVFGQGQQLVRLDWEDTFRARKILPPCSSTDCRRACAGCHHPERLCEGGADGPTARRSCDSPENAVFRCSPIPSGGTSRPTVG